MKTLLLIFLILLPACTTVSVTQPDGVSYSYTSFKDLENAHFKIIKKADAVWVDVYVGKASSEIAGKIAEGAVKGAIGAILP